MINHITFLPAATQDIRKVHDWYETQKQDLGKKFTALVLTQVEELQKNIVVHRFFYEDVRYVSLKKFPYSIFYRTEEKAGRIVIVAVLGNRQDGLTILRGR